MVTEPFVRAIARAVDRGVEFARKSDGELYIAAPPDAVHLGRGLRVRAEDILKLYDWRSAGVADPRPCALCREPAILRDPVENRPCHKVCVDALLRAATPTETP